MPKDFRNLERLIGAIGNALPRLQQNFDTIKSADAKAPRVEFIFPLQCLAADLAFLTETLQEFRAAPRETWQCYFCDARRVPPAAGTLGGAPPVPARESSPTPPAAA